MSAKIEIKGQEITLQRQKASGVYHLPEVLTAALDKQINFLSFDKNSRRILSDANTYVGLHRALLSK